MSDTITITGNVATEPEHKRTTAGVTITSFRVASGQRRFDRTANAWVDTGTNWYSVSAFRGLADHAFQSLRKGDRVILSGRLRLRAWENGDRRGTAVEIDAEAIGHDLRWGTSTFSKDGRAAGGGADRAWDQPSAADAWTPPGVVPDRVPEEWDASTDPTDPAEPAEAVGVTEAVEAKEPLSAETPF